MNKCLLLVLLLCLFTVSNAAQDEELGKNEFTVWGVYSPDSITPCGQPTMRDSELWDYDMQGDLRLKAS